MQYENLDYGSITEARRKAIEQSIHAVPLEDLKSLGETLFPIHDNPWREVYFELLRENAASTFYRATTNDRVEIIYCHGKENGMWFIPGNGMGPLQAKGLHLMKEIVEGRKG